MHQPAVSAQAEVLEDLLHNLCTKGNASGSTSNIKATQANSTQHSQAYANSNSNDASRSNSPATPTLDPKTNSTPSSKTVQHPATSLASSQGTKVTAQSLSLTEKLNVDQLPKAIVVGCYENSEQATRPRVWPQLFEPAPEANFELKVGQRWQWLADALCPPEMPENRRGYRGAVRSFVGGGLLLLALFVGLCGPLHPLPAIAAAAFMGGFLARNPWSGLMAPIFAIGLVTFFLGAFQYQLLAPIFQFSGLESITSSTPTYLRNSATLTLAGCQSEGLLVPLLGMALLGGSVDWMRCNCRWTQSSKDPEVNGTTT